MNQHTVSNLRQSHYVLSRLQVSPSGALLLLSGCQRESGVDENRNNLNETIYSYNDRTHWFSIAAVAAGGDGAPSPTCLYYAIEHLVNPRNFSINPKNLKEYINIIKNLKKENFKINKNDLYYFHFVKNLFSKNHIFFQGQNRYFDYVERKPLRFTPIVYKYWLEDFNLKKHHQIKNDLADFINEGDYFYLKSNKF